MNVVLDGRATYPSAVLAMGMFDGLHIGHQVLLKKAKALADQFGVPLVACTFEKHPLTLIAPKHVPSTLTTMQERCALMETIGVDLLFCMPFGQELLDMPPENYIGELVRRFHPMAIVCGYNHHFGSKGAGSPALLHALGHALDFETVIIPKVMMGELDVSASQVRKWIAQGDVMSAMQCLRRPYEMVLQADEHSYFTCVDANKQQVSGGVYRAIAVMGDKKMPVVVRALGEGRYELMSSVALPNPQTLTVQFLCKTGVKNKKIVTYQQQL